jgi:hypothetical protein
MTDNDWREFFMLLRSSLLAVVRWIEKKYGLKSNEK